MNDLATTLARTYESLRALAEQQHAELKRAQAALAAADCAQTTAEELGDAICHLAGQRDHARAQVRAGEQQIRALMEQRQELHRMLTTMGRALGIDDPDTPTGRHQTMHRVLHLAARQPALV